jgi:hypothetical protein
LIAGLLDIPDFNRIFSITSSTNWLNLSAVHLPRTLEKSFPFQKMHGDPARLSRTLYSF